MQTVRIGLIVDLRNIVHFSATCHVNLSTPNVNYSGRTAPLTSKVTFYIFIQLI